MMRRLLSVIAAALILAAGSFGSFADMGIPESPKYTVAISIYGAPYYSDGDSYNAGDPEGTLTGGAAFYVWTDYGDGTLRGTTNPKANGDQYDSFVYINSGSTVSSGTNISPDVGSRLQETLSGNTTDALNLRTGPGTGFKVLKVLDKGTKIVADYTFQTDTTWMYVAAEGLNGWVCGDYVEARAVRPEEKTNEADTGGGDSSDSISDSWDANDTDTVTETGDPQAHKKVVTGIILICIGVAILIAVLVVYILKNRNIASGTRF